MQQGLGQIRDQQVIQPQQVEQFTVDTAAAKNDEAITNARAKASMQGLGQIVQPGMPAPQPQYQGLPVGVPSDQLIRPAEVARFTGL